MDDNLEVPTSTSLLGAAVVQEEEEQSSGDEDQGPDWTTIPRVPPTTFYKTLADCVRVAESLLHDP